MSLLLDALQRASKDKEKATSVAVAPEAVSAPVEPAAPPPTRELTLEWDPPVSAPPPPPPPPSSPPPSTLASVVEPPEVPEALAPMPALVVTPPPVQTPVTPQPAPPSLAAPVAPPVLNQERVAKEIRRAYAPPSSRPVAKRLLYVLGALVGVVLLGVGSVLGGVWGDPAAVFGLVSGSPITPYVPRPVVQAPVVVQAPEQAVSDVLPVVPAPVVERTKVSPVVVLANQSAKNTPTSTAPIQQNMAVAPMVAAAPASSAAPSPASQVQMGNEVVLRSATAQSNFVAKNRGPSPLEVGYLALQEGRLDDAVRFYAQALKTNPEERDALLGLAYIAQQKGLREEAQGYYRRVVRQEPNNAIASAALLALDSEADAGRTASRARELVARQPDSAATLAMAGSALVRDGMLSDALQMFARAQALEPTNPLHAYNRAVALDRLGQYGAAVVQYERVLQLAEQPSPSKSRAYSVEVVRNRLEQLRQALSTRTDSDR